MNNNNRLGVIQSFIGFKMNEEIFLVWNKTNIEKNNIYIMQAINRDSDELHPLQMNIGGNIFSLKLPLGEPIHQNNVIHNHSITASFWSNDKFVVLKPINIYQYQYEDGWGESLNYVRNVVEVLKLLTISINDDGLYLLRPQYVFQDNYAKIHKLYTEICKASMSDLERVKLRVKIKQICSAINIRTLLENSQFFIIGSETTYYMIGICNYKRFIIKFKQINNFETRFSDLKINDFEITIIENINDIIDNIKTNLKLIIKYNEEYSKRDILMPIIDEILADPNNYENNYLFEYALDLNDATNIYKMQFINNGYHIIQNGLQTFYIDYDFNLYLRAHDTTSQIIIPYIYDNREKKYVLNLDSIVDNLSDNFWGKKINGNHISFAGRYSNVIFETNHIIVENDADYNKIPPYMLL